MEYREIAAGFVLGFGLAAACFHHSGGPFPDPRRAWVSAPSLVEKAAASERCSAAVSEAAPAQSAGTVQNAASPSATADEEARQRQAEAYARNDVTRIEREIDINSEQRERLFRFFLTQNIVGQLGLSAEEFDRRMAEVGTIETILGEKLSAELQKKQLDESTRMSRAATERHLALVSRIAHLDKAAEDELRDTLNSDDSAIEESVAYAAKNLSLSSSQETVYRQALHQYMLGDYSDGYEKELEPYGGLAALGPEYAVVDDQGESAADFGKVTKFLVRMKLKPYLSSEQFKRLEDLQRDEY